MSQVAEFLRAVLPEAGWYSAAYKYPSGAFAHVFVDSIEALVATFTQYNTKANVYFTTGSVVTNSRTATAKDIEKKKALYLDIDVGADKPYKTLEDAEAAFDKFVASFGEGFPRPLVVHSGNGFQAYWPLTDSVRPDVWKAVAEGFKSSAVQAGLEGDHSCTADIARVLRAPGTVNLKGGKTATIAQGVADPRPIEYFQEIFGATIVTPPKVGLFATPQVTPAHALEVDEMTRMLSGYVGTKKFLRLLEVTGCGVVKNYVDNQVATAREPEWRAMLSIAQVCEDKDEAIKLVSEGHPGYVWEQARDKAALTTGAYSCNTLRAIFGETQCDKCPARNRVNNPISLAIAPEVRIIEIQDSSNPDPAKGEASTKTEVTLPYGYFFRGDTICTRVPGGKDEPPIDVLIYPTPFYAISRYIDPVEGESLGFRLHKTHEGISEFVVPLKQLVKKDTMQSALAAHGVLAFDPGHVNLVHRYIGAFAQKLQQEIKAVRMHARCGWTDDNDEFVIGNRLYSTKGVTSFPTGPAMQQLANKLGLAGSATEWAKVLALYEHEDLLPHRFALCAAAGAPLLKFSGDSGAVINFYSKGSGTGKTTLLRVICSLFGHPKELMLSHNDTYAAKINRLGVMGNIPVTVDEVTNMTPEEASKFLYSVTDGRERNRLSSKANTERVNNSQWVTQVITTANAELSGKIELNSNSPEGELARVMDVHARLPEKTDPRAVDKVLALIRENHGWYGHMAAAYIVNNKKKLIDELTIFQDTLNSAVRPAPAERFYMHTMNAAYMGSVLLERVMGWKFDRMELVEWFQIQLNAYRGAVVRINSNVLNSFNEFLNESRDRILVVNGELDARKKAMVGMPEFQAQDRFIRDARQKVCARWEPDSRKLWVVRTEFARWAHERRINVRELMDDLAKLYPGSFVPERKRISKGTSLDLGVVDAIIIHDADQVLGMDLNADLSD